MLIKLIGRNAGGRFKTPDLIDLNAVVGDACVEVFEKVAGQVFSRRVKFLVKGRQFIDISVIEVCNDLVGSRFEIAKIDEQTNIIQLLAAGENLDLIIVPMQVLALPLIPAQLMCT